MSNNINLLPDNTIHKLLLKYRIYFADNVKSRNGKDYRYIYVTNHTVGDVLFVSNIDFVQQIYALHGIILEKYFSVRYNQYVLRLNIADIEKLTKEQQCFLNETAPIIMHNETYNIYKNNIVSMVLAQKQHRK